MLVSSPSQAEYMARIRGVDRERCLVVPVDVGKRSAMALVADHCHEVVVDPFTFELNDDGVRELLARANEFAATVGAGSVRFGVESAGHYHRGLVTQLHDSDCDVVEANPAAVKDARGRIGQRRVETDIADCLALAEVLIDGLGHTPTHRSGAMATQAAWAGQRRRKASARGVLVRQIHAQVGAFHVAAALRGRRLEDPCRRTRPPGTDRQLTRLQVPDRRLTASTTLLPCQTARANRPLSYSSFKRHHDGPMSPGAYALIQHRSGNLKDLPVPIGQ